MTEAWDGYPEDRERDSEGHVWRVDGDVDVYRWTAARQWYEDRKGRWVTPPELVADGDTYYGRIVSPAEIEAVRQGERDRLRASGFSAAAEEVRGMAGRIRAMDPVRLEVLATAAALEQAADMLEAKSNGAPA
jgi:hypothetical protein